jgi:hypothetical protein
MNPKIKKCSVFEPEVPTNRTFLLFFILNNVGLPYIHKWQKIHKDHIQFKNCVCTVYQYVFQAIITCIFIVVITVTLCKRKLSLMILSIKNKTRFPSKFATGERSYSWVNVVNMKPPPPPSSSSSSSCFVHMYYIKHFCKLCYLCICFYWL